MSSLGDALIVSAAKKQDGPQGRSFAMTTMPNNEPRDLNGCSFLSSVDLEPCLPLMQRAPTRTEIPEIQELKAELARLKRQMCGLKTALDMLTFGIVFVGAAAEVSLTNAQADRHLKADKVIRLSGGRLILDKSVDQRLLHVLLESAIRPVRADRSHAGGCMQIAGACGRALCI